MTPHPASFSRRQALQVGSLGAIGLSLADWCGLKSSAQASTNAPAKSCILIWLDGGPSHLDLFDLKPDAPEEVRGPFKPIETNVPGLSIGEMLPETAKLMQHVAVLRSMTSPLGEHNFGSHYLLTGYKPSPVLTYPSYGSTLAHLRRTPATLPPYVSVPDHSAMAAEGFLPRLCRPFAVGGDPSKPDFRVRDLDLAADMTADRLARRRQYVAALDAVGRHADSPEAPVDPQFEQAYRLVSSPSAKAAFDLTKESSATRARYGGRSIGQSCLLARRLVEAGVPFVTVNDRGWDTHDNLVNRLKEGYAGGRVGKGPLLDQAYSALLSDLAERGLLSQTLVIVMGEFGRTPKLNTAGGRDHWPRAFSVLLAGGGVRGGQAIGESDSRGESPADRPITPNDLAATIYSQLGIAASTELRTSDGRPVVVNAGGQIISEAVS